jgi:thiol-disulfide isomerase/thioredoxin
MKWISLQTITAFALGFLSGLAGIILLGIGFIYFVSRPFLENLKEQPGITRRNELPPPPLPAIRPASFQLKFKDLAGKEHSLSEYQGQNIVLNFWATWCPPCMAEMPSLVRLADQLKGKPGFAVLCLSDETAEKIRTKQNVEGLPAPVFTYDEANLPAIYKTTGIPATFIISSEGKIVFSHVGSARWDDASVLSFLSDLAGKGAPRSVIPSPQP